MSGKIVKERSLPTDPALIAAWLGKTDLAFERVGHEAGPMWSWLHEGLSLPVVCVEARHMQTALAAMRNKTDRNDASLVIVKTKAGKLMATATVPAGMSVSAGLTATIGTAKPRKLQYRTCLKSSCVVSFELISLK